MIEYRINKDKELTVDEIRQLITNSAAEAARRQYLHQQYDGKQDILNRTVSDPTKPNNRLVNNYPAYITDSYTGYFMGVPVTYKAAEGAPDDMLIEIKALFDYNDEQSENAELAKEASITGDAYELLYLDSDSNVRFTALDYTETCIAVYDAALEGEMLYFIRAYDVLKDLFSNEKTQMVEVYDQKQVSYYTADATTLKLTGQRLHYFNDVPVVVYKNNKEGIGDFEREMTLINAYDKMQSDSANDLEYFTDAYLVLRGLGGTTAEDVFAMKEQRVLSLSDADSHAEWLIKQINDTYIENLKNRIDDDIHKFSKCPKLTDESFANNLSGIAIKYKLIGFENVTSVKERYFKKALQRRIELICNVQNLFAKNYDYTMIDMTFARNIPVNATEAADMVNKITGVVSRETALGQLPFVTDVEDEISKIDAESPTYEIAYQEDDEGQPVFK